MLIFGYGSLVHVEHLQRYLGRDLVHSNDFMFCQLKNFCRCWTAAMDNRINVPGYKYYVEKHTGHRPDGVVTFLNIRPCKGKNITGIIFNVSKEELIRLDQREQNYRKIDVTAMIDAPVSEKVYAYIGLNESERRYHEGLRRQNAMISQEYYDLVYGAYASLGKDALVDYVDTTEQPQIPIVHLEKRQIPDVSP